MIPRVRQARFVYTCKQCQRSIKIGDYFIIITDEDELWAVFTRRAERYCMKCVKADIDLKKMVPIWPDRAIIEAYAAWGKL